MNMQIDRQKKLPVYMQIANDIRAQILGGELPDGGILPSERVMAQMLGVHRNTVSKAYGELKADGLLRSRQGSGYRVTELTSADEASTATQRGKSVNWVNQIKPGHLDMDKFFDNMFEHADSEVKYSLSSGISQVGIYDRERVAHDISTLIQTKDAGTGFYSPYKGDRELRKRIAAFLSTKGIRASDGEIQVLQETNQAISFLGLLLLKPGDTVVMEEPVSPDVYRMVELMGAKACCIPVDRDGMDCAILERVVRQRKPRFIFVNSSFHDPTGVVLSPERRRRIVEISNAYRVPIVEEDAASELVYEGPRVTPIKALDTLNNVIYVYSFSLTFVTGFSLAFVVADKKVIDSLSYLTSVSMASPDWMTQKLAAMYLEDGTYFRALDDFRVSYRRKRQLVCDALDAMRSWGVEYERPRGGVYIWCRLPERIDSKQFAESAYSRGVAVMPGYVFYPSKKEGRSYIRINYSYETEERLAQGMELLRRTLAEERQKTEDKEN